MDRVRETVQAYATGRLTAAKAEAVRAERRLETLKAEQQRLLQLSYRDLVDDDVLAAEQARIRHERAQVAKWAKQADLNAEDISAALEKALALLNDPGTAYKLATPMVRRMFNQDLFDKLLVRGDDVTGAEPTEWVTAFESLADALNADAGGSGQARRRRRAAAPPTCTGARNGHGPGVRGHGLNVDQVVRMRGLEPPRSYLHTDLNRARLPIPPHPPERPTIPHDARRASRPRVRRPTGRACDAPGAKAAQNVRSRFASGSVAGHRATCRHASDGRRASRPHRPPKSPCGALLGSTPSRRYRPGD
jgi:hypothetical protein